VVDSTARTQLPTPVDAESIHWKRYLEICVGLPVTNRAGCAKYRRALGLLARPANSIRHMNAGALPVLVVGK